MYTKRVHQKVKKREVYPPVPKTLEILPMSCYSNVSVKEILDERGITIKALSKELGRNRTFISRVINGKAPGYKVRIEIARKLNVSYEYLWGGMK